jgi:hypothetical protein
MLLIAQIIYIKPGQEKVFDEFEAVAIPLIARYNGTLLFRVRPCAETFIEGQGRPPYEIHLVSFPDEADFIAYGKDPVRASFLHLKEASVDRIELIKENVTA